MLATHVKCSFLTESRASLSLLALMAKLLVPRNEFIHDSKKKLRKLRKFIPKKEDKQREDNLN